MSMFGSTAEPTAEGGTEPESCKPSRSMKVEQKWQLSCSLTWAIAALCLLPVFASRWDCGRSLYMVQGWLMEKDKTLQLRRREEKRHTWHMVKCILSSCSDTGGSGWVLTMHTMKTIKSHRNTRGISFRPGPSEARIVTQIHMYGHSTCASIFNNDCEDLSHEYKSSPLMLLYLFSSDNRCHCSL